MIQFNQDHDNAEGKDKTMTLKEEGGRRREVSMWTTIPSVVSLAPTSVSVKDENVLASKEDDGTNDNDDNKFLRWHWMSLSSSLFSMSAMNEDDSQNCSDDHRQYLGVDV
jgi:hypothetical protein